MSASWPRISLVTPSFRQAAYLEQALRSVLDQQYPNLEYFVYNNASDDGSAAIIQRYASRLAGAVRAPDRGQSHAINQGLSRATGDILGWLNADDVLLPGALETVAAVWREAPFDVLSGHARYLADDGRPEPGRLAAQPVTAVEFLRLRTPGIPQQATFWSAATWRRFGPLDESLHYVMDLDFWLRLLTGGVAWRHLDRELAGLRHHPAQKTHDLPRNEKILDEKSRVFARLAGDARLPARLRREAARGCDRLWVKAWKLRQREATGGAPFLARWLAAPLERPGCLRVRAFYGAWLHRGRT